MAGGAGLVVGGDGERRLGDVGRGGRLGQGVIAGVGAAEAQSRHVTVLSVPAFLSAKAPVGAGGIEGDGVAADDTRQRGAAHIEGGAGGGVIDLLLAVMPLTVSPLAVMLAVALAVVLAV